MIKNVQKVIFKKKTAYCTIRGTEIEIFKNFEINYKYDKKIHRTQICYVQCVCVCICYFGCRSFTTLRLIKNSTDIVSRISFNEPTIRMGKETMTDCVHNV